MNASRADGSAIALVLAAFSSGTPISSLRTGTSSFFPVSVAGMAGT